WDEARARRAIEHIVGDAEARFSPQSYWPLHPKDADSGESAPVHPIYFGAGGVMWGLHYLQAVGAARLERSYAPHVDALIAPNRAWLSANGLSDFASYIMGDTGLLMLSEWLQPAQSTRTQLANLIAGNLENPTREFLWGSPGTLLAACLLHAWNGESRWADL